MWAIRVVRTRVLRSGTCENEHGAVDCLNSTALLGVQSVKIGCIAMGDILRTRRQPAGTRRVGEVIIVNVETSGHWIFCRSERRITCATQA
jgi:hypothetical protein